MPLTGSESNLNGKYRVVSLIGEGGMARVWLAEETAFGNRQVAIKEPAPDLLPGSEEELTKRFRREVIVCAALEQAHVSNVVRAITAEPYDNSLLLVLEYMPGGDLVHLLQQNLKGLPLEQALAIAQSLLAALSGVHAHALEIVHRDIKPSNILFDARGLAHLGDFGLAQIAGTSGRSQLQGSTHPGTPLYMAPEQGSSVTYLTPAADLYALGCVLFEMLTGKRYKRNRPGTAASSVNPAAPKWLDEVLAKSLADDPFDRFQDAEEMSAALHRIESIAIQEAPRQQGQRRLIEKVHSTVTAPLTPFITNTESHLVLRLAPGILLPLVHVPAGEFIMGSSDDDPDARPDEKPQHKVVLDNYLIGKYEVTVAQFRAFVEVTGYNTDSSVLFTARDDHPITSVSSDDATAFCRWASEVTGRTVQLPTEAQWEKAARGTDRRIYPWGNAPVDSSRCNYDGKMGTTPVGKYTPSGDSPYGCSDMVGNVWEWVNDWYNWFKVGYSANAPSTNSTGLVSGRSRVLRGGGWPYHSGSVRAACRYGSYPNLRSLNVGFRCAVSVGE